MMNWKINQPPLLNTLSCPEKPKSGSNSIDLRATLVSDSSVKVTWQHFSRSETWLDINDNGKNKYIL